MHQETLFLTIKTGTHRWDKVTCITTIDFLLAYRIIFKFQDLLKWKPPWQMEKDFPYFMSGTDDEGSPSK